MQEHMKFMANHVLTQLNKLGLVKDAQVNGTTINAVAGFIKEYLDGQHITFTNKPPKE